MPVAGPALGPALNPDPEFGTRPTQAMPHMCVLLPAGPTQPVASRTLRVKAWLAVEA